MVPVVVDETVPVALVDVTVVPVPASSCIVSAHSSNISPVFNFFTDGSGANDLIEKNNYSNFFYFFC